MLDTLGRRIASAAVAAIAAAALGGTAHAAPTPAKAAAPHAHPRSAVPWKQIGTGWQLATWAPKFDATERLYLVSPGGALYDVGHLGKQVEVAAWSPDGRHALLQGSKGVTQFDLATGRNTLLPKLGGAFTLTYSRPSGVAILAAEGYEHSGGDSFRLVRYGDDGRRLHGYPETVPGAGRLDANDSMQTTDGSIVLAGADHGMVALRRDGSVLRRLLTTGFHYCGPAGPWTKGHVLANCGGALWSVPLSGAKPTELTPTKSTHSPFGNETMWRYSGGRAGLAPVGCGPAQLVRFDSQGRSTPVEVPSPIGPGARVGYRGHHGDIVDLTLSKGGCIQAPSVLVAYDLRYGTSRMMLGAPQTPGTVLQATPFPTDV